MNYSTAGHVCYLAPELLLAEMFMGSNIYLNPRKPHQPIALHVKYRCVEVYHIFLILMLTVLPSKNVKVCTLQINISRYSYYFRSTLIYKEPFLKFTL